MTDPFVGTSTSGPYFGAVEVTAVGDPFDPNLDVLSPVGWSADPHDQPVNASPQGPVPATSGPWHTEADDSKLVPSVPQRRRVLLPRTLGARLVAGVVILVVLVVASAGAATYLSLSSFLTGRLDQQVGALANLNRFPLSRCIDPASRGCLPNSNTAGSTGQSVRAAQQEWFAIIDPQGNLLPLSSNMADVIVLDLNDSQRAAIMRSPAMYRTVLTNDGSSVRITAVPVTDTAGTYLEVIGLSTKDETNTLNRLLIIELAIGASAVVLAFLATSFGVRLSLRPLHRVTMRPEL